MSGRNPKRLSDARAAIRRRVPDAAPDATETLVLDTSNFGSVRSAAASVRGRGPLDGLLLNAGIVHPPKAREVTFDGNEVVFATNVLGHFALAGGLLANLAEARGRMVWVGSVSTSMWRYDPVDAQLVDGYSGWRAYVQSKVSTTALGFEADRRLRAAGVPVTSAVAHPGYSTSGRTAGITGVNEPSRSTRFVDNLQAAVTQSKEHGAWPLVHALVASGVEGGDYWGPRHIMRGNPARQRASAVTRSRDVADRVWAASEAATGVKWDLNRLATR
jgi:NAD(P)-dependent dehydrogenase (short-subunit alcohol dehydrogenase family)